MNKPADGWIEIDGVMCRVISLLDANGDETIDPSRACAILYQRPEDVRPDGVKQKYLKMQIPKGSLSRVAAS